MKITKSALVNICMEIKGNTFITASVETSVDLIKGHPFNGTVKQSQNLNGALGFSYANSVHRLEQKEGSEITAEIQPRKWGTLSPNRVVVFHTPKGETETKHYLNMKVERRVNASYFFIAETGEKLDSETVKAWKVPSRKPNTQAHLEKTVVVRDIKFDNIRIIKMNGEIYEITD